jgi:hypothetical protein
MLHKYFLILAVFSLFSEVVVADISKTINNETKLINWKVTHGNFQLEFIQRSPQQTRSFFQARGFSKKVANDIATQCVLQTIIRNTQAENPEDSITVSLKEWRLSTNKIEGKPIKLKETWDNEWASDAVSNAARIAFHWATFPTQQTFEPGGDNNWGMISIGLQPNSKFDLQLFWKQGNKPYNAWIKGMQCPSDVPEHITEKAE